MTDDQFARLPQYARDAIVNLRGSVARLKEEVANREAKVAAALGGQPTTIEARRYLGDESAYLRDGSRVRFRLGDGHDEYLEVYADCGALMVHGGRPLVIEPLVANGVHVRLFAPEASDA